MIVGSLVSVAHVVGHFLYARSIAEWFSADSSVVVIGHCAFIKGFKN
jgi:hypothetical protein